ncbi:MAG TPA: hypothetical protein VL500_02335 [Candidatus Eisenbacteria bacterium]|jgi:hypothetical protein|nr:hypothetical protein [Candidatus Eisenbacteria bacterium]
MQRFGGPGLVLVNDHRLRDAVLRLLMQPFPAPADRRDPLGAFAAAMAATFPARWPRSDNDAGHDFLASLHNGQRLGFVAVQARNVLATDTARSALDPLRVIRSSCGASMVMTGDATSLYCHYCGCLM